VESASVFLSPTGSDANSCTQAAPCAGFNRAYHVALSGQAVELAAGSYPNQDVLADASKTSASNVTFRPAAGASVSVGNLDVHGSHVTFQDFTIGAGGSWQVFQNDDTTFKNVNAPALYSQSASNVSVIGGTYGPQTNSPSQVGVWPVGTQNTNWLFDGVTFHDYHSTDLSQYHIECLLVAGFDGLVIRNSRFYNCDVFDVSLGTFNGGPSPRNIVIENNYFGTTTHGGYFSFDINDNSGAVTNMLVRNNSATQEMYFGNAVPSLSNVRAVGNIAPISPWNCDGRIVYSHNVFQGGACGASDKNAPAGFVNPAALDLRLLAGSVAIDAGDPGNYPATDIDGQARPMGVAPDAGADEHQ
jgi:hypothetical protein